MTRRVLIDTGPLVAMRNTRDQHRARVEQLAQSLPEQLFTSWPVITEAAFLLRSHPQEVQILLESIRRGVLGILPLAAVDIPAIAKIMEKYADQTLSLADASLMYLAERDDILEVFTIHAKDFSLFRKADGSSLTLVT